MKAVAILTALLILLSSINHKPCNCGVQMEYYKNGKNVLTDKSNKGFWATYEPDIKVFVHIGILKIPVNVDSIQTKPIAMEEGLQMSTERPYKIVK